MTKTKEKLLEWAINFIKSKDAFTGTLQNIEKNKDGFDAKAVYSDKEEFIIIEPTLKDFEIFDKKLSSDKNIIVVLLNSVENFNSVIEHWKQLIVFEKLTLYFVNIFSHTDKKWAIKPKLHNLISDPKSLKEGLNTLFMNVEPTTEKEFEGKVYKE
jgi:hypothetical protein